MSKIPQSNHYRYFNLEIATISTCNMACTYCFEGEELQTKKTQKPETQEDIIEKCELLLNDQKFRSEYDAICINFWGGEPTLNFEWNRDLINKLKATKLPITYFIYSNGFDYKKLQMHLDLFTEEEQLNDVIRLQISWDGLNNGRVDHKGRSTNDLVKAHLKTLAIFYPKLNITTKATIQPQELLQLPEIWLNHYKFLKEIELDLKIKPRLNINFSPTLNYVDDFDDTNEDYLKELNLAFAKVLKLEEKFFESRNYHLFTWFSNDNYEARKKRLTNCSAGINLMAIDFDGGMSACHGTLYSDLSKEFKEYQNLSISNKKPEFITKFFKTREETLKNYSNISNSCITCEATICYKCPVVNIEQYNDGVKSENFQIRDTRHCSIYKLFGRYDKILLNKLFYKFKI